MQAWHVGQGLYINVMQKPDQVRQPEIPQVMGESCDGEFLPSSYPGREGFADFRVLLAWWSYTDNGGYVDEIDAGVKFKEVRLL